MVQKTPGAVASQLCTSCQPARPNCKKVQFGRKLQEVYVGSSSTVQINPNRAEIPEWNSQSERDPRIDSQTPNCERDRCCKRHLGHLPTRPDAHKLWVTTGIKKFWDTLTQSYLCKESECVHLGRVNFAM